jgi:FkbM family methyltransferase
MPNLTPAQRAAAEHRVWSRMASRWPKFTRAHDIFNDPHQVETLLLDNFLGWSPSPGAIVMDIGANAGIVSAWCALYGAWVAAYEADPVTAQLVRNMAAVTGIDSYLEVVNAAIWTHDGTVPYHGNSWDDDRGRGRNGAIQIVGGGVDGTRDMTPGAFRGNTPVIHDDTPRVPCISLSTAIGGNRWDFVKMDIEGAEFQTLLATPDTSLWLIDFLQIEFHNGWADDVVYGQVIEKLSKLFTHTGAIVMDGEHKGRYHYGHFRNRCRL